jgi:hypothetical protein
MVAVAAEAALASDGSLWTGPRVSGCAWLGPVCGGVTLRYGHDGGWAGETERLDAHRSGVDVLITADLPARARGFVVSPGVALGFGWIRSHTHEPDGDVVELDWAGARGEAHLALATPIMGGVWLYAAAAATVLPGASTTPVEHDGAIVPAEPRGFIRVAVGLSSSGWQ